MWPPTRTARTQQSGSARSPTAGSARWSSRHTETLKLQVDISGTQNVADFLPSTLTITSIVLTKRPDGSFEGTGTSNMVGSVGPCSPAFTETGDRVDRHPGGRTRRHDEWRVERRLQQIPSNSDVKFNCEGQTIGAILAPLGYAYNFVLDLGTMRCPPRAARLRCTRKAHWARSMRRSSSRSSPTTADTDQDLVMVTPNRRSTTALAMSSAAVSPRRTKLVCRPHERCLRTFYRRSHASHSNGPRKRRGMPPQPGV